MEPVTLYILSKLIAGGQERLGHVRLHSMARCASMIAEMPAKAGDQRVILRYVCYRKGAKRPQWLADKLAEDAGYSGIPVDDALEPKYRPDPKSP